MLLFQEALHEAVGFISANYDNFLFFILVLSSHFIEKNAIFRKVTRENLKEAYINRPNVKKIIMMLIALALLPAAQAHDGFMVNSENVLFTSRGDAFFQHFQN